MKRIVLDASALVTFFDERPGADKVEELFGRSIQGALELLMSVVNWGEVYYSVWRGRGRDVAQRVLAEIAQLPIDVVDANLELAKAAAEIHARHKLPYAGCFAAVLAHQRKAALATSDKDFALVEERLSILWITDR